MQDISLGNWTIIAVNITSELLRPMSEMKSIKRTQIEEIL